MIRYINSEGKEYKFYDARVRATSGNFHKHAWTPETSKRKIGETVQGFEKDAAEYEITFTVRGALEDRKTFLDEMQDAFETDVLLERPGRIYFGDYYIDGFVTSSETKTSDIAVYYSQNKVKLYCPRPIWTKENPYTFHSYGVSSSDNKRYPGRYPHRYANGMNNTYIQNHHFTDANFTLVIYGPVVNPQVIIGDKSYLVNIVLEQGALNGSAQNLPEIGENRYQGKLNAPATKAKEVVYPVMITATGDNGGVTEETRDLIVRNADLFPLEFTIARKNGEELGFLDQSVAIDMDLGDADDFEICLPQEEWTKERYWYGNRIFVPRTEYGGILNSLEVMTKTQEIVWCGTTWRGLLKRKIIEPPEGKDHLTVSGDLNDILRDLIKDRFDGLFFVPEEKAGITVTGWQIDRYVTLYDAVDKMLSAQGYRLQISYVEPENLDYGYVSVRAVQIKNYSETLEYSQDGEVQFTVKDYRGGVNHLICAGKGQNEERIILHLYVQKDGSIGKTPYYTGLEENEAVYEFSSADKEKLEEDGAKRLKELQNYKSIDVNVEGIDLEIGDIVGGYEEITGTRLQKPIVRKIIKTKNGKTTTEYKVKGDD